MTQRSNKEIWENIYKNSKSGSYLEYPSEQLVRLFYRAKNEIEKNIICLDYGFGSGNNSEFLLPRVHELFGTEVSKASLDIADKRLNRFLSYKQDNFFLKDKIPTSQLNSKFNLIITWQVLYYNSEDDLVKQIAEIYDFLKKGGILIATLPTKKDICCLNSQKLKKNTYRIGNEIPQQEGCIVTVPEDEEEFKAYFNKFEVIDVGYFENSSFFHPYAKASHYYIVGRK